MDTTIFFQHNVLAVIVISLLFLLFDIEIAFGQTDAYVSCNTAAHGNINDYGSDVIYGLTLNISQFLTISTCSTEFDTVLYLYSSDNWNGDISSSTPLYSNDDYIPPLCGSGSVIQTDDGLASGDYVIVIEVFESLITDQPDEYHLNVLCNTQSSPEVPTGAAINVLSDCDFVGIGYGPILPLSVCQSITSGGNEYSLKYECNTDRDAVLMYFYYENEGCSGNYEGYNIYNDYEYNCDGTVAACSTISYEVSCDSGYSTRYQYIQEQCSSIGKNMVICEDDDIIFNLYSDDQCENIILTKHMQDEWGSSSCTVEWVCDANNEIKDTWIIKVNGENCGDGYTDLHEDNAYHGVYCEQCPGNTAGTYGNCFECGTLEEPDHVKIDCVFYHPWWLYLIEVICGLSMCGCCGTVLWKLLFR